MSADANAERGRSPRGAGAREHQLPEAGRQPRARPHRRTAPARERNSAARSTTQAV